MNNSPVSFASFVRSFSICMNHQTVFSMFQQVLCKLTVQVHLTSPHPLTVNRPSDHFSEYSKHLLIRTQKKSRFSKKDQPSSYSVKLNKVSSSDSQCHKSSREVSAENTCTMAELATKRAARQVQLSQRKQASYFLSVPLSSFVRKLVLQKSKVRMAKTCEREGQQHKAHDDQISDVYLMQTFFMVEVVGSPRL